MTFELRPYQREAIDAVYDYWAAGGGDGLVVIPTAGGKSGVLGTLCKELLERYPDMRIGVITHIKELVSQNMEEILRIYPGAPIGAYSAGLGRRDVHGRIMFMGVQSVFRKAKQLGGFDLLLIDECHLMGRSSTSMYSKFIESCRDIVPDMRMLGLTATPFRMDSGLLHQGKDALFEKIVYEAGVRDLIDQGYLSKLISKATTTKIDTKGLHLRGGEYIQAEIDARTRVPSVVQSAVREIVKAGHDRRAWIVFCTSVHHATDVRNEIRSHGVSCEVVTGETPAQDRDRIIRLYKQGAIKCLTSVNVLSVGFNAPHTDLIALLRPTQSSGLYCQQVGRGFRLADGKEDCLILDFAGLVLTHGPVDDVRPRVVKSGGGKNEKAPEDDEPRGKECPVCHSITGTRAMTCYDCGYEWPVPHEAKPADVSILSQSKPKPDPWRSVDAVYYTRHTKPGSPVSLRVKYSVGLQDYSEWKCFEHTGYAREKAEMWWAQMGGLKPYPKTVDEAIARSGELRVVTRINVDDSGKYPRVRSIALAPIVEAAE